jgi:hypothetical protein
MPSSKRQPEYRACPVQIPMPTRALERKRDDYRVYLLGRERLERTSIVRGLILLALVVLAVSIARAGLERVFVPYWWKP